jgi:Lambda phage tail tape-measure protein (Tape_meas_lam_C)
MNGLLGSPQQKAAYQKAVTDYQNLKIQELELEKKYDTQIEGLQSKLTDSFIVQLRKQALAWQDVHKETESMFMSTLNSMNQNLASFITTGQANWKQLASTAIEEIVKMALQYVESAIFMKVFGIQTSKETAGSNILDSASTGAAAAGASVAAIPLIGWSMVEAVSASTYGMLAAYSAGLTHLEVGAWQAPFNMPANLHKDEMIIDSFNAGLMRSGQGIRGSAEATRSISTTTSAVWTAPTSRIPISQSSGR